MYPINNGMLHFWFSTCSSLCLDAIFIVLKRRLYYKANQKKPLVASSQETKEVLFSIPMQMSDRPIVYTRVVTTGIYRT